jgi:Tfp pilus assembly protein PilN
MKPIPDTLLLPGPAGLEGWKTRGDGVATPEPSATRRAPGWVGLPIHHTISLPVRLLTNDAAQRESAVQLELEAAGINPAELTGSRFEVLPTDPSGRDGAAAVFLIDGTQPEGAEISRTLDSAYAPAALFHPLTIGTASLWQEAGSWVLGIPHETGKVLHAQALCARQLDGDAAAELRCILAALELSDLLPRLERIEVEQTEDAQPISPDFMLGLSLPVVVAPPKAPHNPGYSSRLLPDAVVAARDDRRRQRLILSGLAAFVLVLATALTTFAAALYVREQKNVQELAQFEEIEPDLQLVRDAQVQFNTLDPTLNRDRFVVEIFYQLVNLLPPEGIRVTRFEIRGDSLVIDGEASSELAAINFKGELTTSEFFKEYGFDQGFARNQSSQDGRSTFRAEGRLKSEEEEGELVASQ